MPLYKITFNHYEVEMLTGYIEADNEEEAEMKAMGDPFDLNNLTTVFSEGEGEDFVNCEQVDKIE